MATEQKESEKNNKKGPKSGAKAGRKPKAAENPENKVQDIPEAAEKKPKAAPKKKATPKKKAASDKNAAAGDIAEASTVVSPAKESPAPAAKAPPTETPAAERPQQKKKGRPGRKPSKGNQKQADIAEQKPAEKPAETPVAGSEQSGKQESVVETKGPAIPEAEEAATPAKPPQGERSKKRSGSGKKRGGKKPVRQEKPAVNEKEQAGPEGENKVKSAPAEKENIAAEAPEEAAAPVKEAPRKKKSRSKKSGRKKEKEQAPPPPVEEEPVVIQENKIVIASKNPAKIKAVKMAYGRLFPDQEFIFESISVQSVVSEQPMSDDETFAGALFRAQAAQQEVPDAGFCIGLEGGIEEIGDELQAFGWMVVLSHDSKIGKARTSTFVLPYAVAEMIRDGKELGEADDVVFGKTNSKQESGAVGILTHGLIDRAQYYSDAVIMALIPFKNPEFYTPETTESLETV